MCFYWDVKLWYHLGQKTWFFSLSEAIKFPWWSLRALSLREYTSKSKSFQSSQIIFGRNLPPSAVSHAMLSNMWQTGAETGDVWKGYRACLGGLRHVVCQTYGVTSRQRQRRTGKANLNGGETCQIETEQGHIVTEKYKCSDILLWHCHQKWLDEIKKHNNYLITKTDWTIFLKDVPCVEAICCPYVSV